MQRPYFNFCTYFNSNYLTQGLTLYRSLLRQDIQFKLWVLCFDNQVYQTLNKLNLKEIVPILLKDFEASDEELLKVKAGRTLIEYFFTCTPSLLLYVLKHNPSIDIISYLDADLFFFSNPSPIYEELGNHSILIVRHNFHPCHKEAEIYGIYNVGLLSFRNDDIGRQCLYWWRARCLEWCYDRVEDGRYADQKYLDDWPTKFLKVAVLQNKGGGLAPWNIRNYSLCLKNNKLLIDSQELIFFHPHGLRQIKKWLYDPNLTKYEIRADYLTKRYLYGFYIKELWQTKKWISRETASILLPTKSIRGIDETKSVKVCSLKRKTKNLKDIMFLIMNIIVKLFKGDLWLVITGKVV